MEFSMDQARKVVESGIDQATDLLRDKQKMQGLLGQATETLKGLPGDMIKDAPLMVAMIRDYVTGAYKNVSVKVVASMVAALVYLLKGKDIIPDSIPIVGRLDDIAVIAFAIKFCEKELNEYDAWKKAQ
ncbi:MAG: DUF1232 domain-containing protein [Clostridia bacterium]|nr:DUF1232 domain-containing protein [Clostridia bacterium]